MDSDDVAYFAGLFDGEGYITISIIPRRTGKLFARLELGVAMGRAKPIQDLLTRFGGTSWSGRSRGGNPIWRWIACSQDVQRSFLTQIHPLLRVKHHEAEVALAFLEAASHNARDPAGRLLQIKLKDVLEDVRKQAQEDAETQFLSLEKELGL